MTKHFLITFVATIVIVLYMMLVMGLPSQLERFGWFGGVLAWFGFWMLIQAYRAAADWFENV